MKPRLTIAELREQLSYDPETGELRWHPWLKNNSFKGKPALTAVSEGRRVGMIRGRMYKAHVVCFALHHGRWPHDGMMVDHRDGDGLNNREYNLREATHAQNNANRGSQAGSASAYVGVAWDAKAKRWKGQVYKDGRNHNTRRTRCESGAALLRDLLAIRLHGDYTRLNHA